MERILPGGDNIGKESMIVELIENNTAIAKAAVAVLLEAKARYTDIAWKEVLSSFSKHALARLRDVLQHEIQNR